LTGQTATPGDAEIAPNPLQKPHHRAAPPVGFARVVGFEQATAHLVPTESDQLVRRITKAFETVCHRAGADIYSAGDCDFVIFTDHLTHDRFTALGDELLTTMHSLTRELEPPLELVIGRGGTKRTQSESHANPTLILDGDAEISFY